MPGTAEAREWIIKHRLKSEFGYTSDQANYEMDNHAEGVLIHLKIWSLIAERQEHEAKVQKMRSQSTRGKVR